MLILIVTSDAKMARRIALGISEFAEYCLTLSIATAHAKIQARPKAYDYCILDTQNYLLDDLLEFASFTGSKIGLIILADSFAEKRLLVPLAHFVLVKPVSLLEIKALVICNQ